MAANSNNTNWDEINDRFEFMNEYIRNLIMPVQDSSASYSIPIRDNINRHTRRFRTPQRAHLRQRDNSRNLIEGNRPEVDEDWNLFARTIGQRIIRNRDGEVIPNYLETLLHRSLNNSKKKFKKIISEEGEKEIKTIKYNPEVFKDQTFCAITQKKFECDINVSKLPCGHIFEPDAILKWVKEESATCPVCRFKLKSKEKKTSIKNVETQDNIENTSIGVNRLINNLRFIQEPINQYIEQRDISNNNNNRESQEVPSNIRNLQNLRLGPLINRLLYREEELQEERDLQEALMASLSENNS